MSIIKHELEQGTERWLEWRKTGVSASDSSCLFDANPYKTKRDLWFEKAGFDGEDLTEAKKFLFSKGHDIEEAIRELYMEKLGVLMKPACYSRDEIILASLDGENENEGLLEAKYVGKDVVKKAHEGEIPAHHRVQVNQQLLVTGYDKAHYVCSNDGKDFVAVIVRPDKKLQEEIREKIFNFWNMVLSGKAPELGPQDTMFITDADQRTLFRKFKEIHAEKERILQEYKALEAQIKDSCKHPKTSCAGVKVTRYERAGAVNYKKIPELKGLDLEPYRNKASIITKITVGE